MKVTPLEIRQKTFERTLRGYDKDEVNAFLLSLSQEWERMIDETKEIRLKLEGCEREVAKLREVETSLFKTLKTAEDTGANVIDQANKAAELHMREAQMKAEGILNEARDRAKNSIEEADMTSKQMIAEMEDNLKELIQHYKTVESHRNSLVDELKRMAAEAMDRADRSKQQPKTFDPESHFKHAKKEARKLKSPMETEGTPRLTVQDSQPKSTQAAEPMRSFFDEVA